jgi:uncharacterized protein YbjT (DUF2867 family)
MNQKILVAGATGRTGRLIVEKLIQRGTQPHVLVREIDKARELLGEDVVYYSGDVRDPDTIEPAMGGVDIVISAIGTRTPVGKNCPKKVDYQGVVNLVKAAQMQQVQRFILISSIATTHPEHPLNCFGKVLDWKFKGEEVLRGSGLPYTIIRPGGLVDTNGFQHTLVFDQGDRISGVVRRADVAEVCLRALDYPQSIGATFEVIENGEAIAPDWDQLFSTLSKDQV